MKKTGAIATVAAVVIMVLLDFSSCEKYVLPEINFSSDTLFFSKTDTVQILKVYSNVNWEAYSINLWISLDPMLDYESTFDEIRTTEITVKAAPNEGNKRTGTINVNSILSGTFQKSVVVIQE